MNSPPTERSAATEIHFPTTHDERVFWLDQAWRGPWFPVDARIGWLGTDSSLAFYMVRITHAAIDQGIPLASLWDAESPHGHLRRAVVRDSAAMKNSEGSQPQLLTPEIVTEVYEIIMASEKPALNNTPSEHPSDKSDDGDSIDLPTPPQAEVTTTAQFEPLAKTENEFRLKHPIEHQDGLSAMPPHVHHEDKSNPLKRIFRTATYASSGTTSQQSAAEVTAITGITTQSGPIDKNPRFQPALEAYMGSPDLSTRPETFASPNGLLQLPSSPMQSPEHSLLPYVSSPPADEPLNKAPTPTSPMTPTKKRKRAMVSVPSTPTHSVRSERLMGPLTVEKILRQLTCDVQLTDDVVELVCQAIVVEHGDDNVRLLSPLWFEADELSALPQTIRNLDQEQTICFPIHHKFPKHWTMGVARVTADQVVLTFHDSMQCSERANTVRRRFGAWMEAVRLKQPLVFQTKVRAYPDSPMLCQSVNFIRSAHCRRTLPAAAFTLPFASAVTCARRLAATRSNRFWRNDQCWRACELSGRLRRSIRPPFPFSESSEADRVWVQTRLSSRHLVVEAAPCPSRLGKNPRSKLFNLRWALGMCSMASAWRH